MTSEFEFAQMRKAIEKLEARVAELERKEREREEGEAAAEERLLGLLGPP